MKIRGPLVTLAAVAALGVGILLVNMSKEAPPANPYSQSTTTAAAATPAVPPPAPSTPPPPPAFPAQADYVGKIPTASGTITLEITVQGDKAVAYACDGITVESWLRGSAVNGALSLANKDKTSRLEGHLEGNAVVGTLWIGEKKWDFNASRCAASRRTLCLRERRRSQQLDRRPEWGSDRRATAGGRVDRSRAPADDRRHREHRRHRGQGDSCARG